MRRTGILIAALIITILHLNAQDKAVISFENIVYDFGKIQEKKGPVSYDFMFENTGQLPLIINEVKATCGCTSPEWSRQPVIPGQNGKVQVKYDPRNRPGPFSKTVSVISNAKNRVTTLTVKGEVIPENRGLEEIYRYNIGDLNLKTIHASFGVVKQGEIKTKTIDVANITDHELEMGFQRVPEYIKINPEPEVLKPGQEGKLYFSFNGGLVNDWDYIIDRLYLKINEQPVTDNRITVSALVQEDFSDLTPEELATAPKVHFSSKTFDFGTISNDKPAEYEFILTNKGQRNLIIRKVRASCGCTVVHPQKNTLAPGESTGITARFNPSGRKGNQKKSISVVTNDPKQAKTILWIQGTVEDK